MHLRIEEEGEPTHECEDLHIANTTNGLGKSNYGLLDVFQHIRKFTAIEMVNINTAIVSCCNSVLTSSRPAEHPPSTSPLATSR